MDLPDDAVGDEKVMPTNTTARLFAPQPVYHSRLGLGEHGLTRAHIISTPGAGNIGGDPAGYPLMAW